MSAISKTIDSLTEEGGLKGVDVANITQVDKATVSRWRNSKVSPRPDVQIVLSDLKYVVDCLAEFYQPDEIRVWLQSKNRLLEGERAIDLIREHRTNEVIAVIDRLRSHAFL